MIPLLLGIFIAALLFGALLWCGYRAFISEGLPRYANIAGLALTILVMAMITYQMALPGRAIGIALTGAALMATYHEDGWSRLLPFTLATFGVFATLGLPFS